jgi:putative endonuclease
MHRRPTVRTMAAERKAVGRKAAGLADPERLAAWRRGRWSEALCRLALRLKGYRILACGWRCPQGEIDIVARRGGTVAIVEVKARRSLEAAGGAVTARQRRRLEQAAGAFVARNSALSGMAVRFDVMLVAPGCWPRHLPDAWREGGR